MTTSRPYPAPYPTVPYEPLGVPARVPDVRRKELDDVLIRL